MDYFKNTQSLADQEPIVYTGITHSGKFHADEVFASVILSKFYGALKVNRVSKVPDKTDDHTIVYDIGLGKYDHHQKGGNGKRNNGVPYSSVGLIWRDFGKKIISNCANVDLAWQIVDETLIQSIDMVDNGKLSRRASLTQPYSIYQFILQCNPTWDSAESPDTAFSKAVLLATSAFDIVLKSAISKANAFSIIEASIEKSDNHILILDRYVPWEDLIYKSENPKASKLQFVIYPSDRGGFVFHSIPITSGSLSKRKTIPESWLGLSGSKLQNVSGVSSATFCHNDGSMGVASTLDGAVTLAKYAMES